MQKGRCIPAVLSPGGPHAQAYSAGEAGLRLVKWRYSQ